MSWQKFLSTPFLYIALEHNVSNKVLGVINTKFVLENLENIMVSVILDDHMIYTFTITVWRGF